MPKKKYKLLIDLPDCEGDRCSKGSVLLLDIFSGVYYCDSNDCVFSLDTVEENPDWFEKVRGSSNEKDDFPIDCVNFLLRLRKEVDSLLGQYSDALPKEYKEDEK